MKGNGPRLTGREYKAMSPGQRVQGKGKQAKTYRQRAQCSEYKGRGYRQRLTGKEYKARSPGQRVQGKWKWAKTYR